MGIHELWTLMVNGFPLFWGLDIDTCLALAHTISGADTMQCAAQEVMKA